MPEKSLAELLKEAWLRKPAVSRAELPERPIYGGEYSISELLIAPIEARARDLVQLLKTELAPYNPPDTGEVIEIGNRPGEIPQSLLHYIAASARSESEWWYVRQRVVELVKWLVDSYGYFPANGLRVIVDFHKIIKTWGILMKFYLRLCNRCATLLKYTPPPRKLRWVENLPAPSRAALIAAWHQGKEWCIHRATKIRFHRDWSGKLRVEPTLAVRWSINWHQVQEILSNEDQYLESYPGAWYAKHLGRAPRNKAAKLRAEWRDRRLIKNFKFFLRWTRNNINAPQDTIKGAAIGAYLFGADVGKLDYSQLVALTKLGKDAPPPEGAIRFMWKHRSHMEQAVRVALQWGKPLVQRMLQKKAPLSKVAVAASYHSLIEPQESEFPILETAIEAGYSPYDANYLCRFAKETGRAELESIPAVEAEVDGYRMYRLPKGSYTNLVAGHMVNCCQHAAGAARKSARHSMEDPHGCTYVVEKGGKTVALSWVWRNGNVVCFDSIEALSEEIGNRALQVYEAVAKKLIGRLGIQIVAAGTDAGKADLSRYKELFPIPEPYTDRGTYSDASNPVIIASEKGAEPRPWEPTEMPRLK